MAPRVTAAIAQLIFIVIIGTTHASVLDAEPYPTVGGATAGEFGSAQPLGEFLVRRFGFNSPSDICPGSLLNYLIYIRRFRKHKTARDVRRSKILSGCTDDEQFSLER